MKILEIKKENKKDIIEAAIAAFKKDGIVIYPTETCYGVGVLATSVIAVQKVLKYKKRPEGKAISIAVADQKMAEEYVEINSLAKSLYKKFLPGPVTVISKSKNKVAQGLASEANTLGIRIPNYRLILDILNELKLPITATSANSSGKKTPYKIEDILDNLSQKQKDLIDLIIDAGELPHNPSSTVIDTTKEDMQIVRQGNIDPGKIIVEKEIMTDAEMREEGEKLMQSLSKEMASKAILLLFNAEMGAGKTQFVKGLAAGLNITDNVNSPTFNIIKEYEHKTGKLVHIDAWRLEKTEELEKLNLGEYLVKGNVVAVEWAGGGVNYFYSLKNKGIELVEVEIIYTSEHTRRIKVYYQSQ